MYASIWRCNQEVQSHNIEESLCAQHHSIARAAYAEFAQALCARHCSQCLQRLACTHQPHMQLCSSHTYAAVQGAPARQSRALSNHVHSEVTCTQQSRARSSHVHATVTCTQQPRARNSHVYELLPISHMYTCGTHVYVVSRCCEMVSSYSLQSPGLVSHSHLAVMPQVASSTASREWSVV